MHLIATEIMTPAERELLEAEYLRRLAAEDMREWEARDEKSALDDDEPMTREKTLAAFRIKRVDRHTRKVYLFGKLFGSSKSENN
jgi:hypothetical protein